MADEKTFISQLNSADTANDTDIMIIEGEETKKISFLALFNAIKKKISASLVFYDNSNSGLEAENVQGAIDEVSEKSVKNSSDISVLNTKITVTISAATQSNYTVNGLSAFKRNGMLDLHVNVNCVTPNTTGWITIGTLPSDCRPETYIYKDMPYFNAATGYAHIRLRVTTAGLIQLNRGTADADYVFHDMFIV